jgi:hypothetical protein
MATGAPLTVEEEGLLLDALNDSNLLNTPANSTSRQQPIIKSEDGNTDTDTADSRKRKVEEEPPKQ